MLLVHVHINGMTMIHDFDVGKTLYTGNHFHFNLLEMKVWEGCEVFVLYNCNSIWNCSKKLQGVLTTDIC